MYLAGHHCKAQEVPDSFVKQCFEFQEGQDPTQLIKQFYRFLDSNYSAAEGYVFKAFSVDLNTDGSAEIILTLGESQYKTTLAILKRSPDWKIIFSRDFHSRSIPDLTIVNNVSHEKAIDIEREFGFGTGVYQAGHEFYKMIGDSVFKVLELTTDAYLWGWGYLTYDFKCQFRFENAYSDKLWATYSYSSGTRDGEIIFKRTEGLYYKWNPGLKQYLPQFGDNCKLDSAKLSFIADFGTDSTFVETFKSELLDSLSSHDQQKAELIADIINEVKEKKFISPKRRK